MEPEPFLTFLFVCFPPHPECPPYFHYCRDPTFLGRLPLLAGLPAWVGSSVSRVKERIEALAWSKTSSCMVFVGHARHGTHGFGYFRNSLPFRSADSCDQPPGCRPHPRRQPEHRRGQPSKNSFCARERRESDLADPMRGVLTLICPSTRWWGARRLVVNRIPTDQVHDGNGEHKKGENDYVSNNGSHIAHLLTFVVPT